jgi:hypothetical protein
MAKKSKLLLSICTIFLSAIIFNCSPDRTPKSELYPLQKVIDIPEPTPLQKQRFNSDIKSEFVTAEQADNKNISGYRTKNKFFLEEVLKPLINPHLNELKKKNPTEIINIFILFSYEIYQKYFGRNFYRWGGDILDMDDPQERGTRYNFSFGLDCSGFVSMAYELAVYFGLLKEDEALFSSKGYRKYCMKNKKQDLGGRKETGNNFRLDTRELAELGSEVVRLEKNQIPNDEQIKLLKPGDIVGRSGHFGIIAELNDEPYYFESGGSVVPKNNEIPVKAFDALKIFASRSPITIRRCLVPEGK